MILGDVRVDWVKTRYGRLFVPANDAVIGRSLKLYGEWAELEIDLLSQYVNERRAIIDVGANLGTHSAAFASRFPRTHIIAVEPQPLMYALLSCNIVTNNWPNVEPVHAALGDKQQILHFSADYQAIDNFGAVSLRGLRGHKGRTPIVMTTLDLLAEGVDVGLVKVDVEGMEPSVFRGARRLLGASRPVVFFEVLTRAALEQSRSAFHDLDYDFYWAPTQAFNPNNFNEVRDSIWSLGELGVIAAPRERGLSGLEPVPATLKALPDRPETPQYDAEKDLAGGAASQA